MSPKASFGNFIASSLRGIIPLFPQDNSTYKFPFTAFRNLSLITSATRDCEVRRQVDSTYQFRCAMHTELEFHNKVIETSFIEIIPQK
jgi:hypothetical protein